MISIKKATEHKFLNQIVEFQIQMAYETEGMNLDRGILTKGVDAVLRDSSKGEYFLAFDEDRLVGMLLIIREWSDWRAANVLWIHSVYVIKDYRGRGVFKSLYNHIKAMVEKSDDFAGIRLYVDKTNVAASTVYQKIGMSDEHYNLFEWLK